MIARPNASIVLPFLLTALMGCHSAAPTTPAAQTPANSTPASANTKAQGCDAISDPAAAEDCRFRTEVLKKRQKSNASPVVTHAPGTIKQP